MLNLNESCQSDGRATTCFDERPQELLYILLVSIIYLIETDATSYVLVKDVWTESVVIQSKTQKKNQSVFQYF